MSRLNTRFYALSKIFTGLETLFLARYVHFMITIIIRLLDVVAV